MRLAPLRRQGKRSQANLVPLLLHRPSPPPHFSSYALLVHTLFRQDESVKSCPKALQANIESGEINLWGLKVPLPIRGSGIFEVLYLDDELRVFRSGQDTYAVQVKEAALPALRQKFGSQQEA